MFWVICCFLCFACHIAYFVCSSLWTCMAIMLFWICIWKTTVWYIVARLWVFRSEITRTVSKHFKMGIYGNPFWAHVTLETRSVIWAVISWNSHSSIYSKHGLLISTQVPMMYFDRRVPPYARPFWRMVDFDAAIFSWKPKSKHRGNISLSGKSGESTTPTSSKTINLASR